MRLLPFSLRLQFSNNRLSTIFGVHSYTRHSCPPHYRPTIFHIHTCRRTTPIAGSGRTASVIRTTKWVRAARAADQSGRSPGHVDLQSMKAETRSCAVLHSPTRFSQRVAADSSTNKLRIMCTSIPKLTYIVLLILSPWSSYVFALLLISWLPTVWSQKQFCHLLQSDRICHTAQATLEEVGGPTTTAIPSCTMLGVGWGGLEDRIGERLVYSSSPQSV